MNEPNIIKGMYTCTSWWVTQAISQGCSHKRRVVSHNVLRNGAIMPWQNAGIITGNAASILIAVGITSPLEIILLGGAVVHGGVGIGFSPGEKQDVLQTANSALTAPLIFTEQANTRRTRCEGIYPAGRNHRPMLV